jgi:hypothetical protein
MTRLLDSVRAALIKRHWNQLKLLIQLLHRVNDEDTVGP